MLVGAAHAEARIDRMDISMSQDEWFIKQAGHIQASSLLKLETDPETGEITDYDTGDFGVAGFGLGFDLGATYELIDNLTLSAALTDIGFMQWNNLTRGETDPTKEFRYTGFDNIGAEDDEEGNNPFDDKADELGDDLEALAKFYKSDSQSVTNALRTTIRIGAEYSLSLIHIYWLAPDENKTSIVWGGQEMKNSPEEPFLGLTEYTLSGNEISAAAAKAVISTDHEQPSWGAMYWQYYDDVKNVTSASVEDLALSRQIVVRQQGVQSATYVPVSYTHLDVYKRQFLNMTVSGQVASIISVFVKIIVVIFILHILLLLVQFVLAGIIGRKNPLRLLKNMLPAYATALGTQSSAATIPVTLAQTIKNGVSKNIATFVIPLCATIHLSGSTMKITACAMAIMMMSGMPINTTCLLYTSFIIHRPLTPPA